MLLQAVATLCLQGLCDTKRIGMSVASSAAVALTRGRGQVRACRSDGRYTISADDWSAVTVTLKMCCKRKAASNGALQYTTEPVRDEQSCNARGPASAGGPACGRRNRQDQDRSQHLACTATSGMKRSRKASSTPGRTTAKAAWQQVKVDDAFFTGADVGGFLGLEELAPAVVKTDDYTRPAKRRKQKDLSHHTSSRQSKPHGAGATAVAEQEDTPTPATSTLPHTQIKPSANPEAAPAPADAEQSPRIGKKAAAGKPKRARQEEGQPAAAAPASPAEAADKLATVKAWERFGLHPQLLSSLADKGFTDPTPIQQRCISTAIWDGRNIVGAAQTVGGDSCKQL